MNAAGERASPIDPSSGDSGDPVADDSMTGGPAGGGARYVAIITDGNGRWARARGVPINDGHSAGADTVKARLRDAVDLGIQELTVYSFSTENWSRPADEVQGLMEMFSRRIAGETPELHGEGVRMRFIGRREGVSEQLREQMGWAERLTSENRRITLFVAFNYGGRAEILDAARRFAAKRVAQSAEGRQAGPLALQSDEAEFRACLYAPEMHDPDLIIRTSGERRLSNYLLWQSAYSELVFRDELWPDFTREALEQSLAEYAERRRRFGGR
jgi:undecaprenyl diphosphate synthase